MPLRSHEALHDLAVLLKSRHGLLHLETADETRAATLLHHVADRVGLPLFVWSRARGLRRVGIADAIYDTEELDKALTHILHAGIDALYHLEGIASDTLEREVTAALAREVEQELRRRTGAAILTGPSLELPAALRGRASTVRLPGPSEEEFRVLLGQIVRDVSERQHVEVTLSEEDLAMLMGQLSGLTLMEAEKILTRAVVEDGRLDRADIAHIARHKREIVEREGLLEYYPVEASLSDIADLRGFKAWLTRRTAVIRDPDRARAMGLPFPKGVLLMGVPGCGKSLSAKALAAEWNMPLLRLDPSVLYNKYIGETERNFRRAMETAERMAPVVLWIDEIEKAFSAGSDTDGGVSRRLLGSFLSWLQDRRGDVFVIATANDVQRLPPELVRKGRFDELFFVDLPDAATRHEIFEIHLRTRELDPATFELDPLVEATAGFSGSELEQVVVSALYTAFAEGEGLRDEDLRAAAGETRPLSVTMAERIERLRRWAAERTVSAN
ncbi:MAG: AAA family ATPase [Longimicrobiales bacterium]|nr:AAA family ATPase [Longimicrobiales bacterium]